MKEPIQKALTAHAAWKVKLKSAIASGSSALNVEEVRADDQCEFGRWLHGKSLASELKASAHYGDVRDLHQAFHRAAADVVAHVQSGKREQAEASMKFGGAFSRASGSLEAALARWDREG